MNGGGGGGRYGGGSRKVGRGPPPLPTRLKERDEDLLLFRDMLNKSEKDRTVSLLQPVSDEFEPTGNYALHRKASAKKGPGGVELLSESEKNDYDWLKTPPATPLFPSLEMETNSPELVLQREIPITQPLSRFAGNSEAMKKESSTTGVESKFQKVPPRSITPIGRPNRISAFSSTNTEKKNTKSAPILFSNPKILTSNQLGSTKITTTTNATTTAATDSSDKHPAEKSKNTKPMNQKESQINFLSSNLSKSMQGNGTDASSKTKPKSRGVSPQVVRPRAVPDRTPSASRVRHSTNPNPLSVPARAPSASRAGHYSIPNPTVPDRAPSASRTRHSISQSQTIPAESATMMKGRRQSSSPSVNRGRKAGPPKQDLHNVALVGNDCQQEQKGGGHVLGSRMVDKILNARKSCAEERESTKPNKGGLYGSINESSGFGRIISKSSLDMAVKYMEIKREPINFRQQGTATGRKFTTK